MSTAYNSKQLGPLDPQLLLLQLVVDDTRLLVVLVLELFAEHTVAGGNDECLAEAVPSVE